MSNSQQSGNGQNPQRQREAPRQQQQGHHNQYTRSGGEQLWNDMNARVGNPNAQPIDPRLVVQAVGPIQGLSPAASTRNQPQQQTTQGQPRQPTVPQPPTAIQGANPGAYRSQPQAMNVVRPQQPASNAQGHQQFRFRPPMTSNQQAQGGNTPSGNVGVGRGVPSTTYGPGQQSTSWFRADPFQDAARATQSRQPGGGKRDPPQTRR